MSGTSGLKKTVGSLLWVGFDGTQIPSELTARLARGEVGGITIFKRNLEFLSDSPSAEFDETHLKNLLNDLRKSAGSHRLLISIDQEGGRVQRLKAPLEHYPPMLHLADLPEEEAAKKSFELGKKIGEELAHYGFDIDFAPVLDIHTNEQNPIIGDRAFGTTPEQVIARALLFARGLLAAGILPCGKHFPGHGDTSTDSHLELPSLPHDLQRLRKVELAPFAAAAKEKIPLIMTAHVLFTQLDAKIPATLSHRVVTELLKNELGYDGVVVSDDLDMKAIANHFGVGDAAVLALEAGCHALLLCRDVEHQAVAFEALLKAAERNSSFAQLLAAASGKVGLLKPSM